MTTPFTDNPRITLLRSLEDECASRYAEHSRKVVELLQECAVLREQRDKARKALRMLLEAYADGQEMSHQPIAEAKEALK